MSTAHVNRYIKPVKLIHKEIKDIQTEFLRLYNGLQTKLFKIEQIIFEMEIDLLELDIPSDTNLDNQSEQSTYDLPDQKQSKFENNIDQKKTVEQVERKINEVENDDNLVPTDSDLADDPVIRKYRELMKNPSPIPDLSEKHRSGRSYRSLLTDITINYKLFKEIHEILTKIITIKENGNLSERDKTLIDRYNFLFENPKEWLEVLLEEKRSAMEMKALMNF